MSSLENSKIFAILVAGIVAMLAGFISEKVVHPEYLKEDAVPIEGLGGGAAGGAAKAAAPDPILHLIATADLAKGEKLSKACAACHSFDQGGPSKVEPNLYNVVMGPKAHISDFAYSEGLKAAGGKWTYDDLNQFFWKPKSLYPDTKMNYIGLKKPEDRAAIIAWLRSLSASPAALPTEAEIAAEAARLAPPPAETPADGDVPAAQEGVVASEEGAAAKEDASAGDAAKAEPQKAEPEKSEKEEKPAAD